VLHWNIKTPDVNSASNCSRTDSLDEIKDEHRSIFVDESCRRSSDYREFRAILNSGEYSAGEFKRIGKGEVWIQASCNTMTLFT
jgi:hypothetical protein